MQGRAQPQRRRAPRQQVRATWSDAQTVAVPLAAAVVPSGFAFATAGTGTLDALWEAVDDPFAVHQAVTQAIDRYGRGPGGV